MPLAPLREELALLPGPVLADGQPSWTLHDPIRNRYFNIDWPTFEVLRRWSFGDIAAIADAVRAATTLQLSAADVEQVTEFLRGNQLLQPQGDDAARRFATRLQQMRGSWLNWLLHHYLFFRVPLWRPDRWLDRWLPLAQLFFSRSFLLLTLLALVAGLTQVVRQSELFLHSLVDTFTWSGLASYGVAVIAVKLLHELGHAFAAKRHGCRVPTMGVAFLVMLPMAYTDTNDTWRLTRRGQRLQVAAAGIVTELAIAAWCTLAWALLPDGSLRAICFVLATTSWIATVAVNASPFMRFDGYFIVSDWLDLPNLHERSFALARWRLRELLFGLDETRPEHFSRGRERALILFAWSTWLYRLVVFIGIALLVYHFFFKLLGIALFVVEICWFIALPIRSELHAWRERWPAIRNSRRARLTGGLLLLGTALLFAPWPARITASALLRPVQSLELFAPGPAQLIAHQAEGAKMSAGATLMQLRNPQLEAQREMLQARVEQLRWQASTAAFGEESRHHLQSLQEQLAAARAELGRTAEQLTRYTLTALFSGDLRDIDPDLHNGQWLAGGERLGVLVGDAGELVETWLPEEAVKRIAVGDNALFIADSGMGTPLRLQVATVDADATRVLPNGLLAAPAGGHLPTRERDGKYMPEQAVYRVTLRLVSPRAEMSSQTLRGELAIRGRWQAPAQRYWNALLTVLVREAGL